MTRLMNGTDFGRPAYRAAAAKARVRASFLGSRWVQAPITLRREADT